MKTINMLIVEDETLVGMQLTRIFSRLGYQIYGSVTSGEEAVQVVKDKQPEVVLMDQRLAGKIDGLEALQQIRAFSPAIVIFITGYFDETLKEQVLSLPPSVYFVKPVDIDQIKAAIELLLDEKRNHPQSNH